jgi:protein-histidine pros-kinase
MITSNKTRELNPTLEEALNTLTLLAQDKADTSRSPVTRPESSFSPQSPVAFTEPLVGSTAPSAEFAEAPCSPANSGVANEILDALPDAVVLVDRYGLMVQVNRQAEKLFGYDRTEMIQKPVEMLVPHRIREKHVAFRTGFFAAPRTRLMGTGQELTGRHKFGREIPVEISLSPVPSLGGVLVLAAIRDISERKQAEQKVRLEEMRYRLLIQGLPAVTFMAPLDGSNGELYVSPYIEKLLGFSQQEWLGDPTLWYTRLHPDDRTRWNLEFAQTCNLSKPFRSEYRFLARDGHVVWILGQAQVMYDDKGQPLFLQGIAYDISELKQAEETRQLNSVLEQRVLDRTQQLQTAREEADRANHAKSAFLSRMSHELRTPMNAILGFTQLLTMGSPTPKQRGYLEQVNKGGRHLLNLINEVLDLASIEAERMELSFVPLRVSDLFQDVLTLVWPLAERRKIVFQAEPTIEGDPHVLADSMRIKQVLLNLVSNGVKYNVEGGSVTLSCQVVAGGLLRLSVHDTGPGIPPEKLDRLFTPFDRLGADAVGVEGTGLGLVLSKQLTEAMGGTMGVVSLPGTGTTFWVELSKANIDAERTH